MIGLPCTKVLWLSSSTLVCAKGSSTHCDKNAEGVGVPPAVICTVSTTGALLPLIKFQMSDDW